jgi:hypothetical protein
MILSLRHKRREDASRMIKKCWNKFQAPKKVAKILVGRARVAGMMNPDTADIMEYCTKVLYGKEDPKFWKEVLVNIDYELWVDEYTDGPGAPYKNRSEKAYSILSQRFGHSSIWS